MNNELYRSQEPQKKYGALPIIIKTNVEVDSDEMMFYQDMPVKLAGISPQWVKVEERLKPFISLILDCMDDFVTTVLGGDEVAFNDYNVYLSAKRLFISPTSNYNRPGWHSDGFMSEDVNYVWSDSAPTIFNNSEFTLTQDHYISIDEMNQQADPENNITFPVNTLLRMDQYVIHKVNDEVQEQGIRTFVKVTISKNKYDLKGNTHNYEIPYFWAMRERNAYRNVPQHVKSEE